MTDGNLGSYSYCDFLVLRSFFPLHIYMKLNVDSSQEAQSVLSGAGSPFITSSFISPCKKSKGIKLMESFTFMN
jgi:hypothetical protein